MVVMGELQGIPSFPVSLRSCAGRFRMAFLILGPRGVEDWLGCKVNILIHNTTILHLRELGSTTHADTKTAIKRTK